MDNSKARALPCLHDREDIAEALREIAQARENMIEILSQTVEGSTDVEVCNMLDQLLEIDPEEISPRTVGEAIMRGIVMTNAPADYQPEHNAIEQGVEAMGYQ